MFKRKKEKSMHEELLIQLKGLIEIELGDYINNDIKESKLKLHIETYNGLDIYVLDDDFGFIDNYNSIHFYAENFMFKGLYIDDISLVGHYHYEDLLYLILNFKEEKKQIIKNIEKYIEWKNNYLEVLQRIKNK